MKKAQSPTKGSATLKSPEGKKTVAKNAAPTSKPPAKPIATSKTSTLTTQGAKKPPVSPSRKSSVASSSVASSSSKPTTSAKSISSTSRAPSAGATRISSNTQKTAVPTATTSRNTAAVTVSSKPKPEPEPQQPFEPRLLPHKNDMLACFSLHIQASDLINKMGCSFLRIPKPVRFKNEDCIFFTDIYANGGSPMAMLLAEVQSRDTTLTIPKLSYAKFSVMVDFNPSVHKHQDNHPMFLLFGGKQYRWFAVHIEEHALRIMFNNGRQVALFDNVHIEFDRWHSLAVAVDLNSATCATVCLDGQIVGTIKPSVPVTLDVASESKVRKYAFDSNFVFADELNHKNVFKGYLKNLAVFGDALTAEYMKKLTCAFAAGGSATITKSVSLNSYMPTFIEAKRSEMFASSSSFESSESGAGSMSPMLRLPDELQISILCFLDKLSLTNILFAGKHLARLFKLPMMKRAVAKLGKRSLGMTIPNRFSKHSALVGYFPFEYDSVDYVNGEISYLRNYPENVYLGQRCFYCSGKYEPFKQTFAYKSGEKTLNYDPASFTVVLDFCPASSFVAPPADKFGNILIVGGEGARWMSTTVSSNSFTLHLNNQDVTVMRVELPIANHKWHSIAISLDVKSNRKAVVALDGKVIKEADIDPNFSFRTISDKDKLFHFINYSNAGVYVGFVKNLAVYNAPLSNQSLEEVTRMYM